MIHSKHSVCQILEMTVQIYHSLRVRAWKYVLINRIMVVTAVINITVKSGAIDYMELRDS